MTSKLIRSVCVAAGLLFIMLLNSAQVIGATTEAGKTIIAKGDVFANIEQTSRQLKRRSPIFLQDTINTGKNSRTQMRMLDGGLLALQSDSEFAILQYEFDAATLEGDVSMELLKGGLRTVTGSLRQTQSNYALTTPVASIGVRGTHYEAEMIDGDLHLAAWDGVIDVKVGGANNQAFSIGDGQDYRFAIVTKLHEVIFLLSNPSAFADGHSADFLDSDLDVQDIDAEFVGIPQLEAIPIFDELLLSTGESPIDNDRQTSDYILDFSSLSAKSGEFTYNQVDQLSVQSSLGAISNFQISLSINFDTASIPTGNLSFNDPTGEWFAVFNGFLKIDELDVNINFASHNNQLADGFIQGLLIDNGEAIFGNVELFEINTPENRAVGSFIVRESNR
jgi:hypothetical protein